LHNKYLVAFPYGTAGVDITDLFVYMFTGKSVGKLKYNCMECGTASTSATKVTSLFTITHKRYNSIQEHIDANNNKTKKCSHCDKDNSRTYEYNSPQHFRMIGFTQNSQDIEISKTIILKSDAGPVILPICGAIYYTGNHFVSRIISPTGEVWYLLGDAPLRPMFPPISLCHLCTFLLIVASPRWSSLAAPIAESDGHVT